MFKHARKLVSCYKPVTCMEQVTVSKLLLSRLLTWLLGSIDTPLKPTGAKCTMHRPSMAHASLCSSPWSLHIFAHDRFQASSQLVLHPSNLVSAYPDVPKMARGKDARNKNILSYCFNSVSLVSGVGGATISGDVVNESALEEPCYQVAPMRSAFLFWWLPCKSHDWRQSTLT